MQQFFIEQVFVKLDGHFGNIITPAFMLKPAVLQIGAYKYQLQVVDLFYMISYDTFDSFTVLDKIQFKLVMVMNGKIKLGLIGPVEDSKAICLAERSDLL
jgi:hypothetical protein